jgi:hypothetical protein
MLSIPDAVAATVLVAVLYGFASFAVRQRWDDKPPINPLKIVANFSGRASLSSMQVFFFSLVVLWLAIYWVINSSELVAINNTVLGLLGIAVVGSGTGKAVDASRFRVSGENWAWAKKKGWIERDFTKSSVGRTPRFSDLMTTEQGFEVARFQAVAFSLVIGLSMLYEGATAANAKAFSSISIDDSYLALIGISQGVYIGAKVVGTSPVVELNTKLNKVRQLELAFTSAVVKSQTWIDKAPADRSMKLASETCAPAEYAAYMSAATEAAEIVGNMTGVPVAPDLITPVIA